VAMLSRLSDDDLASLYEHCLFTLYPSHYEGWGLPVTEALCHGKLPLVSDASSLPEAGGAFAEYFAAGSTPALAAAAERLILDADYRRGRERQIRAAFRPRAWSEIGLQIAGAVRRFEAVRRGVTSAEPLRAIQPMGADIGVYYPMARNQELRIWRGMVLGEMFRTGGGWWWPDDWGVWSKPGGGDLAIHVAGPHGPLRIYLRIRGPSRKTCEWRFEITSPAGVPSRGGRLGVGEWRWVAVDLPAAETGSDIAGALRAEQARELRPRTRGGDRRVTSVGLAGFFICDRDNLAQRLAFHKAALLNDFLPLTAGYANRDRSGDPLSRSGAKPEPVRGAARVTEY
jgi:hypothetical protein